MAQPSHSLNRPQPHRLSLRGQLRIRRLQCHGLTCPDLDRQCEPHVEYGTVYVSPDGKVCRVRRLRCTWCGQREMTAQQETSDLPEMPGVEVYAGDMP